MARVYTSRQLLDPSILQMRQQADDAYLQRQQQQRQNFYNSLQTGANALGKAIGQGIDAYRDYSKNQEDMAKRRELLGNYNLQGPEEAAIGEEYERTGDPSKLLTLRQIKEAQQMREADKVQKEAEAKALTGKKFDLAIQAINNESDPAKKIPLIENAIRIGNEAGQDVSSLKNMLGTEQTNKQTIEQKALNDDFERAVNAVYDETDPRKKVSLLSKSIDAGKAAGQDTTSLEAERDNLRKDIKEQDEAENKRKESIKYINEEISKLKNIEDIDDSNAYLAELQALAEEDGIYSEIKWPSKRTKKRTKRTANEEQEYAILKQLVDDGKKLTPVETERYTKLSNLKPWSI
jgi:hypothetical protein